MDSRTCLNKLFRSIILFSFLIVAFPVFGQRLSRDFNVGLLLNQVGYVPGASKVFVTKGALSSKFNVIELKTQKVVFSGMIKPAPGDFGDFSTGDFSQLSAEGSYYIKSDTLRSYPFVVSRSVYFSPMDKIVGYFSLQRCGASTTGYLSPCHIDDGIRMDNGKHQDVSGGWHDASDLRKWVEATIYAMVGLGKTYELVDIKNPLHNKILDELLWGNEYFLKMQEPAGYLMNWIGGDVRKHSDSNRWTDNIPGSEEGELGFVKPNAGKSRGDMLIFGTNDDRVIRTDAVNMLTQYNFISAEAMMSGIMKGKDPGYSKRCLGAAEKCFEWCIKTDQEKMNISTRGASILAGIEMYKATKNEKYKAFAVEQASKLMALQSKNEVGVSGFYHTSAADTTPYKHIWYGCLELISLCDMIKVFPSHADLLKWKASVDGYSRKYMLYMSGKNSFGIVPFGLFTKQDPGGSRMEGEYWYRYFMEPGRSWWVGINSNLASSGIGLLKASAVLKDPVLKSAAQRQLDWIAGANPFNSSTIVSVGYNNPKQFAGGEFRPNVPVLPGAVMNGLGGDIADQPVIGDGSWQISEYWTPMVAYTLWLMAEISGSN